jgi:hypothetical protein
MHLQRKAVVMAAVEAAIKEEVVGVVAIKGLEVEAVVAIMAVVEAAVVIPAAEAAAIILVVEEEAILVAVVIPVAPVHLHRLQKELHSHQQRDLHLHHLQQQKINKQLVLMVQHRMKMVNVLLQH